MSEHDKEREFAEQVRRHFQEITPQLNTEMAIIAGPVIGRHAEFPADRTRRVALKRAALKVLMVAIFAVSAGMALAKSPDCASWPRNMALVHLKNAGLIDIPSVIEAQTKAVRLASEKIGKDLYQQVYEVTFHTRDGKTIEVITKNQASSEECSMTGVDIYVVSKKIGGSAEQPAEATTKK